jgi:acyl carrier protein
MNDVSAKTAPAAALRPRLLGLIGQILDQGDGASLPVEARLSELGMSSIKMVNLMLAVEGEFDLIIPQHEITPDTFRSVVSIEAMLGRLLALKP